MILIISQACGFPFINVDNKMCCAKLLCVKKTVLRNIKEKEGDRLMSSIDWQTDLC